MGAMEKARRQEVPIHGEVCSVLGNKQQQLCGHLVDGSRHFKWYKAVTPDSSPLGGGGVVVSKPP